MDRSLALDRISGSPLSPKARGLFSGAGGAIPLFPIETVKKMPARAVGFPRIHGAGSGAEQRVFGGRQTAKMARIDAMADVAGMIDDLAFRNISDGRPVGDPVGSAVFSTEPEDTISVSVERAFPQQACRVCGWFEFQ